MRAVELRHIRCFVSVARHLHFARAAEELGIAPPALTKQIQEAERLLGVRLFHRTKRSVALSAAGEAYLAEALAALDHLARGAELAELAERGELGRIAVGYVGSAVFSGVLQNTVRGFRAIHPRIEVGIREVVMSEVGAMLDDGRIDVAYVRPPIRLPEGVQVRTVHRDTFILALPADSPLAVAQAVSPARRKWRGAGVSRRRSRRGRARWRRSSRAFRSVAKSRSCRTRSPAASCCRASSTGRSRASRFSRKWRWRSGASSARQPCGRSCSTRRMSETRRVGHVWHVQHVRPDHGRASAARIGANPRR
jgi:DNA-binding transcriptional LysR family regulator